MQAITSINWKVSNLVFFGCTKKSGQKAWKYTSVCNIMFLF